MYRYLARYGRALRPYRSSITILENSHRDYRPFYYCGIRAIRDVPTNNRLTYRELCESLSGLYPRPALTMKGSG